VITARDHAKWTHKDENLLWLTTWLENPPLFPAWSRLRKGIEDRPPAPKSPHQDAG
jgi:hypothetical protein